MAKKKKGEKSLKDKPDKAKKKRESKPEKKEGRFISSGLSTGTPLPDFSKHFGSSGVMEAFEKIQRVYNRFTPSSDLLKMKSMYDKLQDITNGTQNKSLLSIAKSMQSLNSRLEQASKIHDIQGAAFLPNMVVGLLPKSFWNNYLVEDQDLIEAAEILDKVEKEGTLSNQVLNKLVELTKRNLAEQQKTNELLKKAESREEKRAQRDKVRELREKIGLIFTIISVLVALYSVIELEKSKSQEEVISEEKLEQLGILIQSLTENDRETTANLNLRSEPNTRSKETILLTIPKGEIVTIVKSINHWRYVTYTKPGTGTLEAGWVSARYLSEMSN